MFSFSKWDEMADATIQGCSKKRCSENIQQIYMTVAILKYDFNKVALHTSPLVLSCNFAVYFQSTFS